MTGDRPGELPGSDARGPRTTRLRSLVGEDRAGRVQPTRVMLDLRPLQEPSRAPITATYLRSLLGAMGREPLAGEDVVPVLRLGRPDPTLETLSASGIGSPITRRRWLPPTSRVLRSLGVPLDGILLRGAQVGVRGSSEDARPAGSPGGDQHGALADGWSLGAVFHTAGGGAPSRSRMPTVSVLLDLAPWELPERYAASAAARLARRSRERALRHATRIIVASRATADALGHIAPLGVLPVRVVPLAADDAFAPMAVDDERIARLRQAHALPPRYLVVGGRYDARSDLATLLGALRVLRDRDPADPPRVVLAGAATGDTAAPGRVHALAVHHRVADLVHALPVLLPSDSAALAAGAVAHVQPALSDAHGLPALEALAVGTPVIASRTGSLPEIVGPSGIIVEPRDVARLAAAVRVLWSGGAVADQVTAAARVRAAAPRRRWSDVCHDTRAVWAEVADRGRAAEAVG